MAGTVWDVLSAMAKYDGSGTAHDDVIADCKKYAGKTVKTSSAWCTETVMAGLARAGALSAVGGYCSSAAHLKKQAKAKGIWHEGASGVLPGDIVLFGSSANHTEIAVGKDVNISGNYGGGCSRRKRSGRTIDGYVRPKYAACPALDDLQLTIAAVDVILGVYGSGDDRIKNLSVFGEKNAKAIQDKVNEILKRDKYFYFAVYIIQGRAGKTSYRKKRLGGYTSIAQERVDDIVALRTHSMEQAVNDVVAGRYGTGAVRKALLRFNGFDVDKIQDAVDKRLKKAEKPPDGVSYRIYPIWFFEKDESTYGDCTAIIERDADGNVLHCILVDTAMSSVSDVVIRKLREQGVFVIDAVIFSHGHGDHVNGYSNIRKSIPIKAVYYPDTVGLDKYQKSYANRLRQQAAKASEAHMMRQGDAFTIGSVTVRCIFIAPAAELSEHDSHHFVNNQSAVLRIDCGGIIYHTAGDLQNDGNRLLINAVNNLHADVYKCQWHGDANACSESICKAITPKIAFSNYHHKEGSGRDRTRKRLEAVGATVYRNHEDGDIFIDCEGQKITVTTSKSGKHDTFTA